MKMLYTLYCDVSLNIRNQFEKEKRIRFWLINPTNMLSEIYSLNQLKFNWINSPVDRCYRSIIEIFSVIFCSLQTRFLEQRRNERNEKKEHKHHLIKCKYNLLLAMSRKSFAWSSNDDRFWRNLNTDYKWYSINFSSSIWFPDVNSSQKRGLYSLDHSRMVLRSRFHWMISFN